MNKRSILNYNPAYIFEVVSKIVESAFLIEEKMSCYKKTIFSFSLF